jgi:hypothetical protein
VDRSAGRLADQIYEDWFTSSIDRGWRERPLALASLSGVLQVDIEITQMGRGNPPDTVQFRVPVLRRQTSR